MKVTAVLAGLAVGAIAAPAAQPEAEAEPNFGFPGLPSLKLPSYGLPSIAIPTAKFPSYGMPAPKPTSYAAPTAMPPAPTYSLPHYAWRRRSPEAEAEADPNFGLPAFPSIKLPSYGLPTYKAPSISLPAYSLPPLPTQSVHHQPWKRHNPGQEELHMQLARGAALEPGMIPEPNPVLVA